MNLKKTEKVPQDYYEAELSLILNKALKYIASRENLKLSDILYNSILDPSVVYYEEGIPKNLVDCALEFKNSEALIIIKNAIKNSPLTKTQVLYADDCAISSSKSR